MHTLHISVVFNSMHVLWDKSDVLFFLLQSLGLSLYVHQNACFLQNCLIQRETGGVRAIVADFGLAARFRKPRFDAF